MGKQVRIAPHCALDLRIANPIFCMTPHLIIHHHTKFG